MDQHEILEATFERWQQVRKAIDSEGVLMEGRYKGVRRVNPLLAVEIRLAAALRMMLRAIGDDPGANTSDAVMRRALEEYEREGFRS